MSLKKELSNAVAREIAQDFMEKTRDLCKRIDIAGSLRRKEQTVHDIDFAVIPSTDDLAAWKNLVTKRVESLGGKVISFGDTICDFFYRTRRSIFSFVRAKIRGALLSCGLLAPRVTRSE